MHRTIFSIALTITATLGISAVCPAKPSNAAVQVTIAAYGRDCKADALQLGIRSAFDSPNKTTIMGLRQQADGTNLWEYTVSLLPGHYYFQTNGAGCTAIAGGDIFGNGHRFITMQLEAGYPIDFDPLSISGTVPPLGVVHGCILPHKGDGAGYLISFTSDTFDVENIRPGKPYDLYVVYSNGSVSHALVHSSQLLEKHHVRIDFDSRSVIVTPETVTGGGTDPCGKAHF